ncbi:putative response regulatory protein [Anaerolineae bacterium]|nr:putative response regulatory protein [Anaerolineae bacterium]
MSYKVFFVEDEIVTREGIRDNVDWQTYGFEFCGEAPDGEMALPLLQTIRPDVLITDIKMPFMDGLQLCKIIRERMPKVKVIILSGHDEFEYAQQAIKLGVMEYLLKPVTVQDLHTVLQRVAAQISEEQREQENLRKLRDQVRENQAALREKFLLKLVMGALSSTEAIEQSESLGIDLIARCYLVTVLKIELSDPLLQFDYQECYQVKQIISGLVEKNPDVFLIEKDLEELVLIMKGNTPEYLLEESELLMRQIEQQIHQSKSKLTIAVGTPKKRIADVYQSFIEALVNLQNTATHSGADPNTRIDGAELLKIDKSAVENYLKCGIEQDFDPFFDACIRPIGETACKSSIIKDYIFIDLVLATAKFVNEQGGSIDQIIPDLNRIGTVLAGIQTIEQIKIQVQEIIFGALAFRDSQTTNQYVGMIQQAKEYIALHFLDPDLSLNQVAAQVNLSPCHFSAVFSQETGTTFKEFLTEIRIKKAKELLRTTTYKSSEISDHIGYNDPHYFSFVFRKSTGFSPKEFRSQVQQGNSRDSILMSSCQVQPI